MLFDILNPLDVPSWDETLLRTPGASFFHGSAWARVLSESYGYTPLYFTVMENEKLRALVPMMEVNSFLTGKRGVSLPFTDYCDPLIDETFKSADWVDLFNQVAEFARKRGWKYVELRGATNLLPAAISQFPVSPAPGGQRSAVYGQESGVSSLGPRSSFLAPAPCPLVTYLGHTMDLTRGEKALQAGLRDSTRRNIKKAEKEKVEIRMEKTGEAMRAFYRLNCMTRHEHGLPPQPQHFFQKIYDHVISQGLGFIALASHRGRTIAGSVFFHFGGNGIYKYGASDRKFQDLRANNLVMWEAVKWFAERGFKTLCLGRTDMENEGLRQFKNGWGAEETRIQYFKYDLPRGSFVPGGKKGAPIYINVFRHTPVPVLNLIGSLFYRHMG